MKQELETSDPKHVHTLELPNQESSGWCQIPPSSRLSSVLLASVKYLASSHPNPSCFSIINRKRKTAEDICKCSMFLTDWLGFWTAFLVQVDLWVEVPCMLVKNFWNRLGGASVLSFHFASGMRRSFESFISGAAGNYGFQAFTRRNPQIRAQDPKGPSFSEAPPPLGFRKADAALHRDFLVPSLCPMKEGLWSHCQALQPCGGCCRPCSQEAENPRSSRNHMLQPLSSEPLGPRQLVRVAEPTCASSPNISPLQPAPSQQRVANEHAAYLCSYSMSPFPTWRQLCNPPVPQ